MEMVAAAKLRRAQEKAVSSRPYSAKMQEVLGRLTAGAGEFKHPLLSFPQEGKIGFVVITGDRGLAGGYNINILRLAQQHIDSCRDEAAIIALGRKGRDYFRYRNYPLLRDYINIGDIPTYIQARELAKELIELFTNGTLREVHLLFNEFISPIHQKPTIVRLLPVETEVEEGEGEDHWNEVEYIFEPSPGEVLGELLPRHIEIQVYHALLEAKASEHGARMTAMGNATDNAQEIIEKLTLSYNRARQAAITKEISEIVGGAEALNST